MKEPKEIKWELTWDKNGKPLRELHDHTYCQGDKHYHGKFFNDFEIEARRMNENIWFEINQDMLLWMANTKYGRDLLCIPHEYGKITRFQKNLVQVRTGKRTKMSDFRIGAKWANVIRSRWLSFTKMAEWYWSQQRQVLYVPQNLLQDKWTVYSQSDLINNIAHATTVTAYPDPDPESTTVDGGTCNDGSDTWTNLRGGAGNFSRDNISSESTTRLRGDPGGTFTNICRGHFLFDTSAITDTDNIDDATCSIEVGTVNAGGSGWGDDMGWSLVTSAPASNTAIANGDHANVTTTKQAGDAVLSAMTNSTYFAFTLNATGEGNVSKTGVTKLGMRSIPDADDNGDGLTDGGTEESNTGSAMSETSGTTSDPKLVVNHSEPLVPSGTGTMLGV